MRPRVRRTARAVGAAKVHASDELELTLPLPWEVWNRIGSYPPPRAPHGFCPPAKNAV